MRTAEGERSEWSIAGARSAMRSILSGEDGELFGG
jgi:hypothetical protein